MAMKPLTFNLPDEAHKELQRRAAEVDKKPTVLAREIFLAALFPTIDTEKILSEIREAKGQTNPEKSGGDSGNIEAILDKILRKVNVASAAVAVHIETAFPDKKEELRKNISQKAAASYAADQEKTDR